MIVKGFSLNGNEMQSIVPDINWTGDILSLYGKLSAVCRTKQDAADLVRWFGHEDFCPWLPVLLCIPGGWGQMAGLGLATAAELRDESVARWELQEARLLTGGFDFDVAREKAGVLRKEDVPAAMAYAVEENIRRHRASPVTDPFPQNTYYNPTHRNLFPVGDAVLPKEASE